MLYQFDVFWALEFEFDIIFGLTLFFRELSGFFVQIRLHHFFVYRPNRMEFFRLEFFISFLLIYYPKGNKKKNHSVLKLRFKIKVSKPKTTRFVSQVILSCGIFLQFQNKIEIEKIFL